MEEVRRQKEQLREEIKALESGFEKRITTVKGVVVNTLQPTNYIRKKPLKSVGTAVAAGFLVGLLKRGRRAGRGKAGKRSNHSSGFTSILMNELKHIAAQKAMVYLSELIDQQLSSRKKSSSEDK
jgi:hypothetical protein